MSMCTVYDVGRAHNFVWFINVTISQVNGGNREVTLTSDYSALVTFNKSLRIVVVR